jgi:N-acetyl-gamma-glutamyl-phosphate reductase
MKKVFIDGSAGTTGLRIAERLAGRRDIELITLSEERRKDAGARKDALNRADLSFLCLPDDAAREAVAMTEDPNAVLIDTSTAHRTAPGWIYGFPEIAGKEAVASSKRIANPGCHASGFVALVAPLIRAGVLKKEALLACTALTGCSGGGKKMIAEYEASPRDPLFDAPRTYALGQTHKHLKEMTAVSGLATPPAFLPIVAPFYSGMEVLVPVFCEDLTVPASQLRDVYRAFYENTLVRVPEDPSENGLLSALRFSGRDDMEVAVFGNDERVILAARFDNLGKGASGAAIQNMNLALGFEETEGLLL